MGTGDLLHLHPSELKFTFELRRPSSCILQLTSITDKHVAFKVKTTNPRKYCVRPNAGIIVPGTACNVTVTMQPQREPPLDLKCNDKFLIQCVVTNDKATTKDINSDMFNKEPGKTLGEYKINVIYVPANIPSPVPEEAEEGLSPKASTMENGNQTSALLDNASRYLDGVSSKQSPDEVLIAKLTNARDSAIQLNEKLLQELDLLRKESKNKNRHGRFFSFVFVALMGLLGVLLGYILGK